MADGLSTAIAALPADRCGDLIDTFAPARAWSIRTDGRIAEILPT